MKTKEQLDDIINKYNKVISHGNDDLTAREIDTIGIVIKARKRIEELETDCELSRRGITVIEITVILKNLPKEQKGS